MHHGITCANAGLRDVAIMPAFVERVRKKHHEPLLYNQTKVATLPELDEMAAEIRYRKWDAGHNAHLFARPEGIEKLNVYDPSNDNWILLDR